MWPSCKAASKRRRTATTRPTKTCCSLGSLFYEPVWLFYREDSARRLLKQPTLTSLSQLPGWRINGDTEGSGVRAMVNQLLEANAVDPRGLTLLNQPTTPAVVSFLEGRSMPIVFVSAPESLMVQMLLRTPGVKLFDFAQAEAYSRRFSFLSPVTLPRGIVDLANDQPPQDVRLVAPTAMMVAREDTHPALLQLLVQAAAQIHGGAGWFRHKGDFPNTRNTSLPLATEAARFYRDGAALAAALPAVLARQPDRPHVGGADLDHRGADPAVAHRAAAVPVSRALARVPLVRPVARAGRVRPASGRPTNCTASSTRSNARVGWCACRCRMPMSCTRCAATSRWCAAASVPAPDAQGRRTK